MVDYLYEPYEMNEPDGFEPLELDDEDYDEDEYDYYDDPYANDADDEYDDYDEYELGGFDDLKPFGSFSDGLGWDDALF